MNQFMVFVYNRCDKYHDTYMVIAEDEKDAIRECKYRLDDETDLGSIAYDILSVIKIPD